MTTKISTMDRNLSYLTDPKDKILMTRIINNIVALDQAVQAIERDEVPTWIDLVMQNGWTSLSAVAAPPQYYKDRWGWVHVRGIITGGTTTTGTVIANLPAGFRPDLNTAFAAASDATQTIELIYYASGDIVFNGTPSASSLG